MYSYLLLLALTSVTSAQVFGDFLILQTTQAPPTLATRPTPGGIGRYVLVNNRPVLATMTPFDAVAAASASAPTLEFLQCVRDCPVTQEYNPICASNRITYFNENKFNCAQFCGADIQIVRRGSCQGLFPMQRG